MSPPAGRAGAIRASARDPKGIRQGRAAVLPPRRSHRFRASRAPRSTRAWALILASARNSHHALPRTVQIGHLVQQLQEVALPSFTLPSHLQTVRRVDYPARTPARRLLDRGHPLLHAAIHYTIT